VLCSFEVVTFLINKQKIPGMLTHFGNFFVQLSGKGAVQNHFITMARCPFAVAF